MKLRTFGNPQNPHILLIHGGGNAWWNYKRQAEAPSDCYHVILPTLDGHCEEFACEYRSTKKRLDDLEEHKSLLDTAVMQEELQLPILTQGTNAVLAAQI